MTAKFWMSVAAAAGLALLIAGFSAARADEQQDYNNTKGAWDAAEAAEQAKYAENLAKAANGTLTDADKQSLDNLRAAARDALKAYGAAQARLEQANWARQQQKNQNAGSTPSTTPSTPTTSSTTPASTSQSPNPPQSNWQQVATDGKTTCYMNYATNQTRCGPTPPQSASNTTGPSSQPTTPPRQPRVQSNPAATGSSGDADNSDMIAAALGEQEFGLFPFPTTPPMTLNPMAEPAFMTELITNVILLQRGRNRLQNLPPNQPWTRGGSGGVNTASTGGQTGQPTTTTQPAQAATRDDPTYCPFGSKQNQAWARQRGFCANTTSGIGPNQKPSSAQPSKTPASKSVLPPLNVGPRQATSTQPGRASANALPASNIGPRPQTTSTQPGRATANALPPLPASNIGPRPQTSNSQTTSTQPGRATANTRPQVPVSSSRVQPQTTSARPGRVATTTPSQYPNSRLAQPSQTQTSGKLQSSRPARAAVSQQSGQGRAQAAGANLVSPARANMTQRNTVSRPVVSPARVVQPRPVQQPDAARKPYR